MKPYKMFIVVAIILIVFLSSAAHASSGNQGMDIPEADMENVDHSEMISAMVNNRSNILVIAGSLILLLSLVISDFTEKRFLEKDVDQSQIKRRRRSIRLVSV